MRLILAMQQQYPIAVIRRRKRVSGSFLGGGSLCAAGVKPFRAQPWGQNIRPKRNGTSDGQVEQCEVALFRA